MRCTECHYSILSLTKLSNRITNSAGQFIHVKWLYISIYE